MLGADPPWGAGRRGGRLTRWPPRFFLFLRSPKVVLAGASGPTFFLHCPMFVNEQVYNFWVSAEFDLRIALCKYHLRFRWHYKAKKNKADSD